MITKEQEIEFEIYIHAAPKDTYEMVDNQDPYKFIIDTIDREGSEYSWKDHVLIAGPIKMKTTVPGGFDIVSGVVKNLEKEKEKITNECNAKFQVIEDKISSLLSLPPPKDDFNDELPF